MYPTALYPSVPSIPDDPKADPYYEFPKLVKPSPKCCCCFSLKFASFLVGLIEFALITVALITFCVFYTQDAHVIGIESMDTIANSLATTSRASLVCAIVVFVVGAVSILCLSIGLIKEYPRLVLVHFFVECLAIVAMLTAITVYLTCAAGVFPIDDDGSGGIIDQEADRDDEEQLSDLFTSINADTSLGELKDRLASAVHNRSVIFCGILAVGMVLETIFSSIVFRCFRFLARSRLQ